VLLISAGATVVLIRSGLAQTGLTAEPTSAALTTPTTTATPPTTTTPQPPRVGPQDTVDAAVVRG
jgi:hypothetical protein